MTNEELEKCNKLKALIEELEDQKKLLDSSDVATHITFRSEKDDYPIAELGVSIELYSIIEEYMDREITKAKDKFKSL